MITATFGCGHVIELKGDEQRPTCHCGSTQLQGIVARAPRFRGLALGPNAIYEELPAKAVTLVATKE